VSRKQVGLLACLVALAAIVAWLALRNPQPPFVPEDEDHTGSIGIEDCIGCHDPDGVAPRGPNHPIGNDCHRCHGSG
jgi:hypothetical protein